MRPNYPKKWGAILRETEEKHTTCTKQASKACCKRCVIVKWDGVARHGWTRCSIEEARPPRHEQRHRVGKLQTKQPTTHLGGVLDGVTHLTHPPRGGVKVCAN